MRSELLLQGTEDNGVLTEGIPAVSVVVPMYNEVESLPDLIEAIASTLSCSQINYEIILVMMAQLTVQHNYSSKGSNSPGFNCCATAS